MNKEIDKKEAKEHHGLYAILFLALTAIQMATWAIFAEGIKQDNTPGIFILLGMLPVFMTAILGFYHALKIDTNPKGVGKL